MPSLLHQSSAHLVQTAGGNPLPAPGTVGVFALTVPDGVTGDLDWVGLKGLTFRILDFWSIKTNATAAASANTLQLQTAGGVAISDALNMQVADQAVVRAAAIDDANHTIAAENAVRVRRVKAGQDASAICYVKIAIL